jgi:hypothetical protein
MLLTQVIWGFFFLSSQRIGHYEGDYLIFPNFENLGYILELHVLPTSLTHVLLHFVVV